jgi:hypothetical protein
MGKTHGCSRRRTCRNTQKAHGRVEVIHKDGMSSAALEESHVDVKNEKSSLGLVLLG